MNYTDIDDARLKEIEKKFQVACLNNAPFKPNQLVQWKCVANDHQWVASYIDLQILNRCFQCDPQDIEILGNGTFAQNMSFTMAKVASDFKGGMFQSPSYLHDSHLHVAVAAFFFTCVRNEFELKFISNQYSKLGLGRRKYLFWFEKFSAVELIHRLYNVSNGNISRFTFTGITNGEFRKRFCELRNQFVKHVEVRNKIAHGFSYYPVTRKGKYAKDAADIVKQLGAGELENAYSVGSTFLAVAEKLMDITPEGVSAGNLLLREYILLA